MDYNKIAQDILDNVGGKANVKQVTHCFTRLRFILKDESLAKKETVEHLEGVISVVVSGGQFQVVCGAKVTKIYDATVAILGDAVAGGSVDEQVPDQKQPLGNLILQKITEIFTPLVPAIAAAGLIKGLLAAFAKVPGFDTANSTYIIMNTASNVILHCIQGTEVQFCCSYDAGRLYLPSDHRCPGSGCSYQVHHLRTSGYQDGVYRRRVL